MNPFKTIKYQLYLLQLENYELGRYLKLLFAKGLWAKTGQRKDLVWTNKAKALLMVAIGLYFLSLVGLLASLNILGILVWLVLLYFYFIFFVIALVLLWPVDFFAKQIIISRAKKRIAQLSNLKIVGIAGSYGKTTMKEVVLQVLGTGFKVLATPESVNTPVGIARWILKNVNGLTQVAIVEMGEHYKGDILKICELAAPNISIITGINEAHLERMKTMHAVAATIFEIALGMKADGLVILNGEDNNIEQNYKKFLAENIKVEKYSRRDVKNTSFNAEKLSWEGELQELGRVTINLLGEYALADVAAAVAVAKHLGAPAQNIIQGLAEIRPVEHRLQPIMSSANVLVIDDSYNGNPDGAAEAIKVLARFSGRRKVFITPGLVEMGSRTEDIHREIGKQLARAVDVVILIKNSVTPFIAQGLILAPYDKRKIIWFDTAQQAHASLKDILLPGDVILFQNDWGDQYV